MSRLLFALFAAIMVAFVATPAAAATGSDWSSGPSWGIDDHAAAFASPALGAEELAAVHGTGIGDRDVMSNIASDQSRSYGSQTSGTLSVQFDNWLNDVAAPLIVSNLTST